MKLAWNIIAFVAIMNLLAVLFFGGWLAATGRVNQDRIETVQTLFALPADIESKEAARQRLAEDIKQLNFEEEASLSRQPMGSDAQIAAVEDLGRREQLLLRRIERENAVDRRALEILERQLTEREVALEKRIAEFAFDEGYPYQPPSGIFARSSESYISLLSRLKTAAEDPTIKGILIHLESIPFSMAQVEEIRSLIGTARARGCF